MKIVLLILFQMVVSFYSIGQVQDTSENKPAWVLHPLNMGVTFYDNSFKNLSDSLTRAGYSKIGGAQTLNNFGVEFYYGNHWVFSGQIAFANNGDTALQEKGHFNFIKKEQTIGGNFSFGYNVFPITKIYKMALSPRLGFYFKRLSVTTQNYDGDDVLWQSVYGSTPAEHKEIRRWESGAQASLKFSISPFRNAGMFCLVGFGLEVGMQRNLNLITSRQYDNGNKRSIAMPAENPNTGYLTFHIEMGRGLFYKTKTRPSTTQKLLL